MQEGFHLTHLDIGHNALTRMDRLALQPSLKEVIADHNQIVELAPNTFSGLANLTGVDLTHNRLRTFPLSALTLTLGKPNRLWHWLDAEWEIKNNSFYCSSLDHGYTLISMSDNPLECDCQMEWILRINSLAANTPRYVLLHTSSSDFFLKCWNWGKGEVFSSSRKKGQETASHSSSSCVSKVFGLPLFQHKKEGQGCRDTIHWTVNSPKLPSLYQIEIYAFLARTRPPYGHTVYYYKERKATCEPYTSCLYRIYFSLLYQGIPSSERLVGATV